MFILKNEIQFDTAHYLSGYEGKMQQYSRPSVSPGGGTGQRNIATKRSVQRHGGRFW